jgi:hypothetical protein
MGIAPEKACFNPTFFSTQGLFRRSISGRATRPCPTFSKRGQEAPLACLMCRDSFLDGDILRGLLSCLLELDLVRAKDACRRVPGAI